ARVVDCFVTRERRATMRQVPGVGRLRPGAATAVPGLVLAGARADTRGAGTEGGGVRGGLEATRGPGPGPEAPAPPGGGPARGRRASGGRQRQRRGAGMTAVMPAGVVTARDLVGPAMTAAVARLSPEVRTVAAYHLGLAGLNGHTPEHGR